MIIFILLNMLRHFRFINLNLIQLKFHQELQY